MLDGPVEHPSWCDRTACSVTESGWGTHVSPRLTMEPDELSGMSASVRVTAGMPLQGYPNSGGAAVELMVAYPCFDPEIEDEDHYVVLRGERAYALGRMLVSAGRQAVAS